MKLELFLLIEMKAKQEADMYRIKLVQEMILSHLAGVPLEQHTNDLYTRLTSDIETDCQKVYDAFLSRWTLSLEKLHALHPGVFEVEQPLSGDTQRALSFEELLKAFSSS